MVNQSEMVSEALYWLVEHKEQQPRLQQLATHVGLSSAHLQRTFQDFVGVSPKQFLKFLTKQEALERLKSGQTVLDTAIDVGLSGPGRLHDLMVTTEAMTPGEARRGGAGVSFVHGVGNTPLGPAFIAWTDRGISFLGFCHEKTPESALEELKNQWPGSQTTEHAEKAQAKLSEVFRDTPHTPLKIWLRGSPFQLRVWEALLAIPPGTHCTYGQIAARLDQPGASRAVGTAIGRNPVSWLIPCHRVITSLGTPGGYRWGANTKLAVIGYEAARASRAAA